ncbi:MAG: lamin tail domain-containing protein [Saprospiraceae bacterium]|nr:lamin tail domain-containing protein [Saprospiraceae bacterium]
MKKLLLLLFSIMYFSGISQTIVYHENFELNSLADSVIGNGVGGWGVSNQLSNKGLRCDTSTISSVNDTNILSTIAFSTLGNLFVTLNFSHICKIEFYDAGTIEVSNDSGATWHQLTIAHYLGNGQFGSFGNKFASTSYTDWLPTQNNAIPTNLWWKNETFNISAFAGNSANVMVRFILRDVNNTGGAGNFGWLIDDIEITAAVDELIPPTLTYLAPVPMGTIFSLGPFEVNAQITDTSGIDTAYIVYSVNNQLIDTVGMTEIATDTFRGFIPVVQDLDTVCYYIVAIDSSLVSNISTLPQSSCISFIASSGIHLPYVDDFDGNDTIWYGITTDPATQWELGVPNYGLLSSAHTSPRVWGINLDTAYADEDTAYLYSPFFDFSTAVGMKLSFWQNRNIETQWDGCHMEYSTNGLSWIKLGGLNDPNGLNWYNDTTYATSGLAQWTGNSVGWIKSEYLLDFLNYLPMVQFRFVFISDPAVSFEGIIIDDFEILPPTDKDAGIIAIENPNSGCGLGTDSLVIKIKNFGSDTINGNLIASFKINSSATVSQSVTQMILPGDTLEFVFNLHLNLAPGSQDSTFNIVSYVSLTGDTLHNNDTLIKSIISGVIPSSPQISDVTVIYSTSTTLTAISSDSVYWYESPTSVTPIKIGNQFTTSILYDTTTYYLEARAGVADIKITEVTLNSTGNGCSNPYPSFISSLWRGIEITNLGNSFANLSNYTVHMERSGTFKDYTIPQGVVLNAGKTLLLTYYCNPVNSSIPSENYFVIDSTNYLYTNLAQGYYIKDPNGNIVDAVAFNGYIFSSTSGVTANDWSGSLSGSSLNSGFIRINSDSDSASDWVQANAPAPIQTIGSLNPMLTLPPGYGCSSNRVAVNVNVSNIPNFDVGILSVDSPVTAINLSSSEPIHITIKNYGKDSISGFGVNYIINNNQVVTDTVNTSIAPGDTLNYVFQTSADLSNHSVYNIKVYPSLVGDTIYVNDTVSVTVVNQLPLYCQSAANYNSNTIIDEVIFNTITNNTAMQCATYSDFTNILTNVYKSVTYQLSVTLGSCGYDYTKGAKVYIDWNCDGDFTDAGEEVAAFGTNSLTTTYTANITIPANASTGITIMRVVCIQTSIMTSIVPCGTYTYGETEDYTINISPPFPVDLGVTDILTPFSPIYEGSQEVVKIRIFNYGTDTLTSIPLKYSVNSATAVGETFIGNLLPGTYVDYTFSNLLTVPQGSFDICAFSDHSQEGYHNNDTMCLTLNGEYISTSFYFNDFDGNGPEDFEKSFPTRWAHGIPAANTINSPHSSPNVWAVNLNGNYLNNQIDDLYTPYFNFESVLGLVMRFYHWYDTELGNDGCEIQYTENGGISWISLGTVGDNKGVNWYNAVANGVYSWTGPNSGWTYSSYDLSQFDNKPTPVRFKFRFRSNLSIFSYNGWAIDDFQITAKQIAKDAGVIEIIYPDSASVVGISEDVKVVIKNLGSDTLYSIPVNYQVNWGFPVNETWTGVLLPMDTAHYSFSNSFIPMYSYNLFSWTSLVGDGYSFNDTAVVFRQIVGLDEIENEFYLNQNKPNPSNDKTIIEFSIPNSGHINFKIADIFGRELFSESKFYPTGKSQIEIDVSKYSAGVYYYSIEFNRVIKAKKMIILK